VKYKIPFNSPCFLGNEQRYIAQSIASGHVSGDGHFSRLCHQFLEEKLGSKKALLTTSCTHALEMSALLLDLSQDDEVIIPSFTFVSTANAFVIRGARPIFADIRADTLNLDESLLERHVTKKTKAIVPVHYAGVGCEMDKIIEFANAHKLIVVEDNAHGLFGKFRGKYLGTFGAMATQSFHETKNFQCGEGGALLINDARYISRSEIIREKGTDRSRFFRGQIDKYTWVDVGSSYLPSDILAAFLYGQFECWSQVQTARKAIWHNYAQGLRDWASANGVRLPFVPGHVEQSFHMFYLIMPTAGSRDDLIAYLERMGIKAVYHYLPLHLSTMGQRFSKKIGECPVTEDVSDRLVRLPFYNRLSAEDQAFVISAVTRFEVGRFQPKVSECSLAEH
jgi:dTDP-4-amino-4,6-dideoxygalactose transaminase